MATLEGLPGIELFIRQRVEEQRKTHQEVSDELMLLHPGVHGLSRMSVQRFCCQHYIQETSRLDDCLHLRSSCGTECDEGGFHLLSAFYVLISKQVYKFMHTTSLISTQSLNNRS